MSDDQALMVTDATEASTEVAGLDPASSDCGCGCSEPKVEPAPSFVYSIGRLAVRLPTTGLRKEFDQRSRRQAVPKRGAATAGPAHVSAVLKDNRHIARAACFVQSIGGVPAYIAAPTSTDILDGLIEAAAHADDPDYWTVLIGKRGPVASPTACGGILAPYVSVDQAYGFSLPALLADLSAQVGAVLKSRDWAADEFREVSGQVFRRLAATPDNLGAIEGHRALNFALVQHPGPYLAAMDHRGRSDLRGVEFRSATGPGGQHLVTLVLSFVDNATGSVSRLATVINVTEEWPFVAENPFSESPLAMEPFVATRIA